MAKYSKKAAAKVERAMKKRKEGTLKSGSGETVKSRQQAIAIGLSEARAEGKKVPKKATAKKGVKKTTKNLAVKKTKKATKKKTAKKSKSKSTAKKSSSKK